MNPMEWYGVEAMQNSFLKEMRRIVGILRAENTSGFERLEQHMTELTQNVEELNVAVAGVAQRVDAKLAPLVAALEGLTQQLETERAASADLAAAEDAEDVAQNEALAAAVAATDASVAEAQAAADEIQGAVDDLNAIAADPVEPEPEPEPVDPEPEPVEPV